MIISVAVRRDVDFHDIPYGIEETIKYKNKLADKLRNKFGLKETDTIFVNIIG